MWGYHADTYVPWHLHGELQAFNLRENGEPELATLRALRLNRFILKYMKTNDLQVSADIFLKEANINEIEGDGDGLLDGFWIPCATAHKMVTSFVLAHKSVDDLHPATPNEIEIHYNSGFFLKELKVVFRKTTPVKIRTCHFSADGNQLAYGGNNKRVSLWNTQGRQHIGTIELPSIVQDVRFRPGFSFLAAACMDGTISCCQLQDVNMPLQPLRGHFCSVESIDFWPEKPEILCSGDSGGELRLWDIDQGHTLSIYKEGNVGINEVRFQSNGGNVLAVAAGKRISLFRVQASPPNDITLSIEKRLEGHAEEVKSLCWNPRETLLASVSRNSAHVWTFDDSWKSLKSVQSPGSPFSSCVFHPANPQLLVIGSFFDIYIWNSVGGGLQAVRMQNPALVSSLAASSQLLASTSDEVTLWQFPPYS